MVLLKCLHYVNLENKSKYFQITRFLYFMLVFNFIMCFLEKDGETFCSKLRWKKGNIDTHSVLDNWTLSLPSFDESTLPHEIFEKFFTTEEMGRIYLESNKYARHKGNHTFTMTKKMLNSFIAILLLSGYDKLPRQEMHWQRRDIRRNRMATALMTKNEFEN